MSMEVSLGIAWTMLGKALISKRCLLTMPCSFPPIQRDIVRDGTLFKYTVEKTIRWAFTNLGSPEQGFGSSISSEVNQFEGAQYLWSKEELLRILDEGDEKDMISQWKPLEGADQNAYLPHLIASESLPLSRQIEALSKLIPFSEAYSKGATDPKRIWDGMP